MKPCDCKDQNDLNKLDCKGIIFNEWGLIVENTDYIELRNNETRFRIPKIMFKRFDIWYMEDQDETNNN